MSDAPTAGGELQSSDAGATSVHTQLRIWIGELEVDPEAYDAAVVGLFETSIRIARYLLVSAPDSGNVTGDAEDLAHEFLLWIKREKNTAIETAAGLKRELSRFATRLRNPAEHELWEILSDALHELFRRGKARRLDASGGKPNSNEALWVTTEVEGAESTHANLARFAEQAGKLPIYQPRGAKGWYSPGKPTPKVISPSDAEALAGKLLGIAGGAIRFRDLKEEFRRHVFVFSASVAISSQKPSEESGIDPNALTRIVTESAERAERIWKEVQAEGLSELLCGYFIPKHFEGAKATLQGFGATSTAGDRVAKLRRILAVHLAIQPGSDEAIEAWFTKFVTLVFERLAGKCPEKV